MVCKTWYNLQVCKEKYSFLSRDKHLGTEKSYVVHFVLHNHPAPTDDPFRHRASELKLWPYIIVNSTLFVK